MKLTTEQERQYEENRLKKNQIDRTIRLCGFGFVLIAGAFFVFSMFASAKASSDPNVHHGWKWYYGMNAAAWNIIFAIGTLVLGLIAAVRSRIASILLGALHIGIVIWVLAGKSMAMGYGNMLLAGAGLLLNFKLYMALIQDGVLREQPGYPLFMPRAEEHAEYEPSPLIMQHPTSQQMDSIGAPVPAKESAAKPQTAPAAVPELQTEALDAAAISAPHVSSEAALSQPTGIALDAMQSGGSTHVPAEPQRQSAEGILADMNEGGHSSHGGNPEALPDPEEVRARLARMRAEREAAQQQGGAQ